MEHTLALIQKSHEGDEEARAQLVLSLIHI